MKRIAFVLSVLLLTLSGATELMAAPDGVQTTNVRVVAYEYYDYYAPPEKSKFKKVKMLKIEGSTRSGSTYAQQYGPSTELEATIFEAAVPSDYWITIVWQDGERYCQKFTTQAQKETLHQIYQPY